MTADAYQRGRRDERAELVTEIEGYAAGCRADSEHKGSKTPELSRIAAEVLLGVADRLRDHRPNEETNI